MGWNPVKSVGNFLFGEPGRLETQPVQTLTPEQQALIKAWVGTQQRYAVS